MVVVGGDGDGRGMAVVEAKALDGDGRDLGICSWPSRSSRLRGSHLNQSRSGAPCILSNAMLPFMIVREFFVRKKQIISIIDPFLTSVLASLKRNFGTLALSIVYLYQDATVPNKQHNAVSREDGKDNDDNIRDSSNPIPSQHNNSNPTPFPPKNKDNNKKQPPSSPIFIQPQQ